ncbi:hypothetical protein [Actinomadura rubrisoli]|uniref:SMI1/KNR4 family protein n=1 Tax=Actinomadura rubrisoli TaxID=2530368 RepID=A0A4R5B449_9ACTN|nr:hypothetical protein [Actinomadura rubrisoli]TDD79056.1 hypothetical protein E1298_28675 [Actinomadura rubrisoli]
MDDMHIGGLIIPPALIALIRAGKWVPPVREQLYLEVFGEVPEMPYFYNESDLLRQNESWQRMNIQDVFGEVVAGESLGVSPRQSVVIADLGPDMPVILDYRETRKNPRVLYLKFSESPKWVQVAADIQDLIGNLYGAAE